MSPPRQCGRRSRFLLLILLFVAFGQVHITAFEVLIKTRETFKLADLQFLAARYYEPSCERMVLDARTGSSLLHLVDDDDGCQTKSFSEGLFSAEIDWIGHVLAKECTIVSLVKSIAMQSATWSIDQPWTLRYLSMMSVHQCSTAISTIQEKSILCAVSQSIQQPRAAIMEDDSQTIRLLIVRVVDDTSEVFYLLQTQSVSVNNEFRRTWARRPFPYSSAINYEIAEMTISLLLQYIREKRSITPKFLDPTCGSGSFLAVALSLGVKFVEGRDSNPACIDGTRNNLEFMFGPTVVAETCQLIVRDSSRPTITKSHGTKYTCMACNLPWGQNTKSFYEENMRILSATRSDLEKGSLCIVIWRATVDDPNNLPADLEKIGYRSIDHAFVPPKDFQLPQSNKAIGSLKQLDKGRSSCVVSILETIM